jgi:hypothetical protein
VVDLVGAASLLVSEEALSDLTLRAKGEKSTAADAAGTDEEAETEAVSEAGEEE